MQREEIGFPYVVLYYFQSQGARQGREGGRDNYLHLTGEEAAKLSLAQLSSWP